MKMSTDKRVPAYVQRLILSGRGYIGAKKNITKAWRAYRQPDFFGERKWEITTPGGMIFNMYEDVRGGRIVIISA